MKNMLLLFGGRSFEHDISIITALIILNGFRSDKFRLLPIYIDRDNNWHYLEGKVTKEEIKDYKKASLPCYLAAEGLIVKRIFKKQISVDGAINCCHGGSGENGELDSLLKLYEVPSTSGDGAALGICMNKALTKLVCRGLRIPTIDYFTFTKDEDVESVCEKAEKLGFPLILKPANLGSSIGIEVAKDMEGLRRGIEVALKFDSHVLVEKALLNMQEYNVACMRHKGKVLVSRPDMPLRKDEILSFKDKYGDGPAKKTRPIKGMGSYLAPKKLPAVDEKLEKRLRQYSERIYEALGLRGVCRVDFIFSGGKLYLNEVNAIPGSLGYYFFVGEQFRSISEFVEALATEGIERFKREEIKKEYITNLL